MTPSSGSGESRPGRRTPTCAKWLIIGLIALCIVVLLFLLPCPQPIRDGEPWVRSAASLGNIAQALQGYHDAYGRLPPAVITGKDGKPLYSWRVVLLPFLERDDLFKQFQLDEPWDSPHNKPLAEKTPKCYEAFFGGVDGPGMTRYQVFVGPGTAFERGGLTWADFPDGLSDTLLVVEAGDPVPWSKPADLDYNPNGPLPALGGVYTKPVHFRCFEVRRTPGFVASFADGKTRFIRSTTDERTIRALITRNGGEKVDVANLE